MQSPLAPVLAEEVSLVERFITLLGEEQRVLKEARADALAELSARKAEVADQLNLVGKKRNQVLAQAGFAADRPGMRSWLAKYPTDRQTGLAWTHLLKLAAKAQEITRLNGQLLALHLQVTQQALATLTQQAQAGALYGPTGHQSQITGNRIIDSV